MIKFLIDDKLTIHRHIQWDNIRQMLDEKRPIYLDIVAPTSDEIECLKNIFHFHPTNLENCTQFSETPKVEEHKNYIFTVIHNFVFNDNSNKYESTEIHTFLGEDYIVSVHSVDLPIIHDVLERVLQIEEDEILKCDHIYYTLLDCIVDNYFPIMEHWSLKIDNVEDIIFDPKNKDEIVNYIVALRKELIALKRIIMPQREALYKISHTDISFIRSETRVYLRDVFDHIAKTYNTIEEYRDILSNLMDAHFSKTSAELNDIMKRLTVISTIFMPLTFIVGVYGMNFKYMPELEWQFGYFLIILIMVALGAGLFLFFKKKKWY